MDIAKINKEITQFGISVIALDATDYLASYAHSIGLWQQYQHPEIIIFGLPATMMQSILNEIAAIIKSGKTIELNKEYDDFFENGKSIFVAVDNRNKADYFGYAIDFYKQVSFDAIELIWTDRNYKFPWEQGFEEEFKFKQPLLDRNADFKFSEEKDLIVWTSKESKDGILLITHDVDGYWHFLSSGEDTDLIECTLIELVNEDNSINDVFDLDYGQCAYRKSKEDKWNRKLL